MERLAQGRRGADAGGAPRAETQTLDGSSAEVPFSREPPGALIGRYIVLERLGQGAMGVVYVAYDPNLRRRIAIKLVRAGDGEAQVRVLREAQALALFAHPNVVGIHDVGSHRDYVFLAMDLVEGDTMRQWIGGRKRSWREIVDAFVQAGRGLIAAHARGVIHRDIKPDNLLVAQDGRVLVSDFGAARYGSAPLPPRDRARVEARPDPLSLPVTCSGQWIGTPAYMPPEVFDGGPPSEACDQFSFCVSLYEALYGERPFADLPLYAPARWTVRLPPRSARVPSWLRQVLLRGLQRAPDQRYPSLAALIAKLQHDPRQRPWRIAASVAALSLTLGALGFAALSRQWAAIDHAATCRDAEEPLRAVWDDGRKQQLRRSFAASGSPIAADSWRRVERLLDDYGRAWAGMRYDSCAATRIRGIQSDQDFTLRTACLDRRLGDLKALVDLVAAPDSASVEGVVGAASKLPPIEGCADLPALRSSAPPPRDPAARARVDALRVQQAQVKSLVDMGKYPAAIELGLSALAEARSIRYRPLEADLLYRVATAYDGDGQLREAEKYLLDGLWAAEAGGDEKRAVLILGALGNVVGNRLGRPDDGMRAIRLGQAILEHMGGDLELESSLESALGACLARDHVDEALEHFERARQIEEKLPGLSHAGSLANEYNSIGAIYEDKGQYEPALLSYLKAVERYEGLLGAQHPRLRVPLTNAGVAALKVGRYDRAEYYLERAKTLALRGGGLRLAWVVEGLGNIHLIHGEYRRALAEFVEAQRVGTRDIGTQPSDFVSGWWLEQSQALSELGRHREAIALARRAVAAREARVNAANPLRAEAYHGLARALRAAGGAARALPYAERALSIWSRVKHPSEAAARRTLGECALDLRRFGLAVTQFEWALSIEERHFGPLHPDSAAMLLGLGRARLAHGLVNQAAVALQTAVRLAEQSRLPAKLLAAARSALAQASAQ